jgi:hypothetical protein
MKNKGEWNRNRKVEVQFHLTIPRGAVLDEIETVNGSVTVADFTNYTKISAVNGDVRASNLRGTANLSTVNGEVFADFDRLETGSRISLNTVNGSVSLTIPSDSSATVKADSVNGNITNDFGLPVRKGQYVGRDLYGRLGAGDVHVRLNSVNGKLAIGRKADGKTPSPAVNLLPQKGSDEDWDKDDDDDKDSEDAAVKADVDKMNRDVARAVRRSTAKSVAAVKDVQKEMELIKPEIAKVNVEAVKAAAAAIDSAQVQEQIRDAMDSQKGALARLRDAGFNSAVPRVEKKSEAIAVKGTPKVTINATGCSVRVRGWDRSEVQYTVTQISDSRVRSPLQTSESHTDSAVNIKVTNGGSVRSSLVDDLNSTRIEVYVPRKSNLNITSDGEIRLEGVSGDVELSGSDESINVRDDDGRLTVTNTDGIVRVIGFRGKLDATTADGDMYLEGDFESLTGNGQSGSYVITVPSSANANIVSTNPIESEGIALVKNSETQWKLGTGGPTYRFEMADGSVLLRGADSLASF